MEDSLTNPSITYSSTIYPNITNHYITCIQIKQPLSVRCLDISYVSSIVLNLVMSFSFLYKKIYVFHYD